MGQAEIMIHVEHHSLLAQVDFVFTPHVDPTANGGQQICRHAFAVQDRTVGLEGVAPASDAGKAAPQRPARFTATNAGRSLRDGANHTFDEPIHA